MKRQYNIINCRFLVVITFYFLSLVSCKKFLNAKSSKSLTTPTSLIDLQALLDDYSRINYGVGAGMTGGDEYYLTQSQFKSLYLEQDRNMYVWNNDDVVYDKDNGWVRSYDNVYRANTILEVISNIERNESNFLDWNNVKGQALFLRGRSFFEVASIWALAYDKGESKQELGIPLRLGTDFNIPSYRSNIDITYRQIVKDLRESIELLPVKPVHVLRSSKPAACGELARVYLSMRQYDSAYFYSNEALEYFHELIDYNSKDTLIKYAFDRFGPEVIYESTLYTTFTPYNLVDSSIYEMFDKFDLRKNLFFKTNKDGSNMFCGSYDKTFGAFGGIASDELYLMRAECLTRLGNTERALEDLNFLLKNRYMKGKFVNYQSNDVETVLKWILDERLKELLFRGLRWMDLKRLNKEGADIVLKRVIGDQVFTLLPNSLKYAMAIPQDIIDNSNIQQNPR